MSIAYWCVLLAGILPIVAIVPTKLARGYDNADPRSSYQRQEGLPRRAYAAHLNSLEAFPFFAAAVVIALAAGGNVRIVGWLAVAFVLVRIGYIATYWGNRPTLRSAVWTLGWALSIAIFLTPVWR